MPGGAASSRFVSRAMWLEQRLSATAVTVAKYVLEHIIIRHATIQATAALYTRCRVASGCSSVRTISQWTHIYAMRCWPSELNELGSGDADHLISRFTTVTPQAVFRSGVNFMPQTVYSSAGNEADISRTTPCRASHIQGPLIGALRADSDCPGIRCSPPTSNSIAAPVRISKATSTQSTARMCS